ncbi:MAG: class I SAM-dependent methyltransferase, partial [Rickettsiales bacterium]|nr:class I SAM-dependent methyltransferase [Rickettsiales bacterium]
MTIEEKFDKYEKLLTKWNVRVNLVANSTLPHVRERHTMDSAQLAKFLAPDATVIDLGSGAGFPAVVLAILGFPVYAIESVTK